MAGYEQMVMEARRNMLKLTLKEQRELQKVYEGAIESLTNKAGKANKGGLTERWLLDYKDTLKGVEKDLSNDIRRSIFKVVRESGEYAVLPDITLFKEVLKKYKLDLGPHFTEMFSQVPQDVLKAIMKGDLYKDGRGLSSRIWSVAGDFGNSVDYMIKKALVEKKSAYSLAKDLEQLVNDPAKRPFTWGTVYPNMRNKKIDFNAQRLARTSITHAHRESQYESAQRNPFVEAIHWQLSSEHYYRQVKHFGEDICDEYARHDEGLGTGNFPKDQVPLGHPQCLCHTYGVIVKSLDQVANELHDWMHGGNNPTLDKWYEQYGEYFATKSA